MVTFKLILDDVYICTCTEGGDITLSCGDSFCEGCIEKIMYKEKFIEKTIEIVVDKKEYRHIWIKAKINCPNCLACSEICN